MPRSKAKKLSTPAQALGASPTDPSGRDARTGATGGVGGDNDRPTPGDDALGGIALDAPGQRRLPPTLRRAWFGINQAFRRRIAHLDITPDQFTVLRWLWEDDHAGLTQRQLTDLMASDPNTITSLLTRMEKAGLIERKPHESDKRAKRVRLKPAGRTAYQKARQVAVDLQKQILDTLPPTRRDRFLAELELMADACRDAADQS
jgi:DNA-binding MarR family transcriptional regulator